jgi:hypothetical protein
LAERLRTWHDAVNGGKHERASGNAGCIQRPQDRGPTPVAFGRQSRVGQAGAEVRVKDDAGEQKHEAEHGQIEQVVLS